MPNEGSFRAHQVPIPVDQKNMKHAPALLEWLNSYRPGELFDENGRLNAELAEILPTGDRRMGMNPVTNAGKLIKDLHKPNFRNYALDNSVPGQVIAQDMAVLGKYLKEVVTSTKRTATSGFLDRMRRCLTVWDLYSK